jgi:hypothetical protein
VVSKKTYLEGQDGEQVGHRSVAGDLDQVKVDTLAHFELVLEQLRVVGDDDGVCASGAHLLSHRLHLGSVLVVQDDQDDGSAYHQGKDVSQGEGNLPAYPSEIVERCVPFSMRA